MGPTCLFDKSFIQSLSIDESVWFDHFFYTNICPLYLLETLADLSKQYPDGRSALHEVAAIADKTPETAPAPCVFHLKLAEQALYGHEVPMTGQIPIANGRNVRHEGRSGVVFEDAPEAVALRRWRQHAFYEVEHAYAGRWRAALKTIDLKSVSESMHRRGIDPRSCKSLEQARDMAQAIVTSATRPFEVFGMALNLVRAQKEFRAKVLHRWRQLGCEPLSSYAPYAAHVLSVELFLNFALAGGHIGTRASNAVDVEYLHYMPFCMAFVSSDNLHGRCAPLFMRGDQLFISGQELKADLTRLNEHYLQLSDTERELGLHAFASAPPGDDSFLVRRIWDQLLTRRVLSETGGHPRRNEALAAKIREFFDAPSQVLDVSTIN